MVNRILSLIGWLGTALVFAAVAIRFGLPAKEQYAFYLAWGGLVCVLAYTLGLTSICGLGVVAPNPLTTALEWFRAPETQADISID